MIECQEDTPLTVPMILKQTAMSAWERARDNIFEGWKNETDPANLQPRVSKLGRQIAEFLRAHSPSGVEQSDLERCLDAIESPLSRRDENTLREIVARVFESDDAKAKALIEGSPKTRLGTIPVPLSSAADHS